MVSKPVRTSRRKRDGSLRPVEDIETLQEETEYQAEDRTRVEAKKPKKVGEWESLDDILDSYIEDMDVDEDIIGGS